MSSILAPLLENIFNSLEKASDMQECSVRCSVVEVYLERMRDLLHEPSRAVQLRQSSGQLVGCATVSCWNAAETTQLIQKALCARTVSATVPHVTSSRSSAVVQLLLQQTLDTGKTVQSRLLLLDLVGSELLQQQTDPNTTLEATQVSVSLKALHKQVRAYANSKPPIPYADLPALTRILSTQLSGSSAAYTTFLCTAVRFRSVSMHFLKFATDCQRCTTQPIPRADFHTPDLNATAEWRHSSERWKRWAERLAVECQRLRDRQSWDRQLWPLVEQITAQATPNNNMPSSSSSGPEPAVSDTTVERMRQYAQYKQALTACSQAQAERDQLCSDLAVLQANTVRLTAAHTQLVQHVETLQRENRALQMRKQQAEETLRVSQFREAEATVFLRQLRRFYMRLVQTTLVEGTAKGSTDAVLQKQLVDMDRFMMQSGLLDEKEVGGDAGSDPRPTRSALERSIAQANREAQKRAEEESMEPNDGLPPEELEESLPLELDRPTPVSVLTKESPEKIEARQKLFQTPSGRYISMREKILETELMRILEVNSKLKSLLDEEKTNTHVLRSNADGGIPLDKMRIAQEIRTLKDQLSRKNNDLKAVIWKMNELHMVGKTLKQTLESRDQRLSLMEQTMVDLRTRYASGVEKNAINEQKMSETIQTMQKQLSGLAVPVWQMSADQKAVHLPLSGRLVVPVPLGSDVNAKSDTSVGEPGEWAAFDYYPKDENVADIFTQTDPCPKSETTTQTKDSVYVVDRENTTAISVQTDDVHIYDQGTGITEDNVFDLMFVESPQTAGKDCVKTDDVASALFMDPDMLSTSSFDHSEVPTKGRNLELVLDAKFSGGNLLDDFLHDCGNQSMPSSPEKTSAMLSSYMVDSALCLDDLTQPREGILSLYEVDTEQEPGSNVGQTTSPFRDDSGVPSSQATAQPSVLPSTFSSSNIMPFSIRPEAGVRSDQKTGLDTNSQSRCQVGEVKREDSNQHNVSASATQVASSPAEQTLAPSFLEDKKQEPRQFSKPHGLPKGNSSSSFMARLQNQAKKKKVDDDETPEFLRLFNTIGAANKNEEVVETSGSAPARQAQRTSFETMKLRNTEQPKDDEPPKVWQPRNKMLKDNSDSSSDDSFAKSFMRGAQVPKHAGNNDDSSSSDDSFAKSFMKGAGMPTPSNTSEKDEQSESTNQSKNDTIPSTPPHATRTEPAHSQGDSDSSSSNDSSKPPTSGSAPTNTTSLPNEGSATKESVATATGGLNNGQISGPRSKVAESDSETDSSASSKPARPGSTPTSSNGGSKPPARRKTFLDSSSSSDSDSDSSSNKRRPAPPPTARKSVPASNTTAKAKKSGSEPESSEDSSSNLKKPKAPLPFKTRGTPPRESKKESDSSSEESEKVRSTVPDKRPPLGKNDSDNDSTSDESERSETIPRPSQKSVPAASNKSDSDSDSSSSDEPKKTSPTPRAAQPNRKPLESSSDDSSSSSEGEKRAPSRLNKKKVSSSEESDSDDSTDSEAKRKPSSHPQPSKVASSSDSDSSDTSDSSTGVTASRRPGISRAQKSNDSSDDSSSSDSSATKDRRSKPMAATSSRKTNISNKNPEKSGDMSKFVIKDGKLVRRDGGSDKAKTSSGGPRSKTTSAKGKPRSPTKGGRKKTGGGGQKPAFKIVGGKLVKNDDA